MMYIMNLNQNTRIYNDRAEWDAYDHGNQQMLDYRLSSYDGGVGCTTNRYGASVGEAGIYLNRCRDVSGGYADVESDLLHGALTNPGGRSADRPQPRTFRAVPYKGMGYTSFVKPDSQITDSFRPQLSKQNKREGTATDRFIPLIPGIASEIQNPDHYVPVHWVRGGMDTRAVVRNIDYAKNCGLKR